MGSQNCVLIGRADELTGRWFSSRQNRLPANCSKVQPSQKELQALRRKKPRNNAVGAHKGKGAKKRRNVFSADRNRASPAPIIKLYDSLTPRQKEAIVQMGHGSFLDIKCEQLHNPVINWFVQCYQPAKRAFVVPCRGTIPLNKESVHLMMGLPRGSVHVKYYADHVLEAEIAARLFPGQSSRPKVSEIGTRIAQYKNCSVQQGGQHVQRVMDVVSYFDSCEPNNGYKDEQQVLSHASRCPSSE